MSAPTTFTGIENNRLIFSLTDLARTTGWSISDDGLTASHTCNPGSITLLAFTFVPGQTYRYTFSLYITSGYLQTTFGAAYTTSMFVDETVTATAAQMYIYANGNCTIANFNIEFVDEVLSGEAQNTVAFSEKLDKWTSFYTIAPDSAFSMFTKTYLFKDGDAYVQEAGTANRGKFFGVQYPATIVFATSQQPTIVKKFIAVNYQANQLMPSTPSGIITSHGEVSELIPIDFRQQLLTDGVITVVQYDIEGMYKASFMRAFPDLVNGAILIGNWMEMGLTTSTPSAVLNLFTTEVTYAHSYQGVR